MGGRRVARLAFPVAEPLLTTTGQAHFVADFFSSKRRGRILRMHFYVRTFQIEARGTFTQHFYLRGPNEQRRSVHFYVIFYFTRLFYGMLLYVHNLNKSVQYNVTALLH